MYENLIKIHCKECLQDFSVIRHRTLEFDEEPRDLEIGYHGRFGIGEEGVWYCPFCGNGGSHTCYSSLVEVTDEDEDEDDEDDEERGN
mgnify:CR=1 FL=1